MNVTKEQMRILEELYLYHAFPITFMEEVLIYKSMTLYTKLIQSLMELIDFLGERIKVKFNLLGVYMKD